MATPFILCAHRDDALVSRLGGELHAWSGGAFSFEPFTNGDRLLARARALREAGADVAMIFCGIELDGTDGTAVLLAVRGEPRFRGTRDRKSVV